MCKVNLKEEVFGSSSDPKQLSLTVKGILLSIIPIVLSLVRLTTGVGLEEDLIQPIIDNIVLVVQQVVMLVSTATVLIGLIRKVIARFK